MEFNIAKGRPIELNNRVINNDPANSGFVIILLKTTEAESVLKDYADIAALLAGANVEADFTGYERKILTDAELSAPIVDNTADTQRASIPAVQYLTAGGTLDNALVKGIVCYASNVTAIVDSTLIPLTAHTLTETTDGSNLNLNAGTLITAT